MSNKKEYGVGLFFFLIGLLTVSITIGNMYGYLYGWIVLGGGLMSLGLVSMILTYLEPSPTS